MSSLSEDRAVLCFADAVLGEQGTCSVLTAESDNSLARGPAHAVGDGATAYLAMANVAEEKALVCYSDWSQSEYGKCRVMNSSGYSIEWGDVYNVTHQVDGNASNQVPG